MPRVTECQNGGSCVRETSGGRFLAEMQEWISDSAIFAWRYVWNPHTLGTPVVCSPFVAKEILRYVNPQGSKAPLMCLEAGAGTGAMTRHLVKKLRAQDQLFIVEIDPTLCALLKKKFGHLPNVHIYNAPIQDWKIKHKFDVIISTVPLNSLPSGEVLQKILDTYRRLVKKEGILSSLEYVGTSTLSQALYCGNAKKKVDEIQRVKNQFFSQYSFFRPIVPLNLPCARITHCKNFAEPESWLSFIRG